MNALNPNAGRDVARRRIRVLLIAEAANPEWPSVPLEGWSHSRAIARHTDAHVVTQVRNRPAMIRAGLDECDFTSIDSERVAAWSYRLGNTLCGGPGKGWTTRTAVAALAYYYFERLVWKAFGSQIAAGEYDVVHRLTPLSPTVPSLIATACRRCGVPFVLGPLNGGVPWPRGFDGVRRREREWLSYVRAAHRFLPGYRRTRRDARAIIVGSVDTWQQMPRQYHHKCVYVPENAVDDARFAPVSKAPPRLPLKLIFVGRLVPYKGADMLIEAAMPLLSAGVVHLTVVGDGPEMPRIRSMVNDAQITSAVRFRGWVRHEQLRDCMSNADLFTFPSIREFGGAVVLEAMAMGVVPVVINYGGPGELVSSRSGYRIPIGPRDHIVRQMRQVLIELVRHPEVITSKASAAQRRARQLFTWDAKARQCLEVYRWVLGRRTDKPDFGMPLPDECDVPEPAESVGAEQVVQ